MMEKTDNGKVAPLIRDIQLMAMRKGTAKV